jgi:hypothetical protein
MARDEADERLTFVLFLLTMLLFGKIYAARGVAKWSHRG